MKGSEGLGGGLDNERIQSGILVLKKLSAS